MPGIVNIGKQNKNRNVPLGYRHRCFAILLFSAYAMAAPAEEMPRWEAGFGLGAVRGPDYRGSDEYRNYLLPIPYLIYRGERLRADRRGVRSDLFRGVNVSVNINATVGLPASSARNEARAGMPDLDFTFEAGPSLNVRLYANESLDRLLSVRLPVRGVVATDLTHAEFIGWVFLPHVAYDLFSVGPDRAWRVGLSAGPIFATNKYHDYYYAVRPEFATPTRPAYDASGGYSGASVGLTITRRYPGYWVGAFVRYDDLSNVVFEDSPLMRSRRAVFAGVAISKVIARSAERVGGEDTEKEP